MDAQLCFENPEKAAEEIEALRAEVEQWKDSAINGGNAGYLREQLNACNEFLKEGESVRDRMIRFGLDVQRALMREAKAKLELEMWKQAHSEKQAMCLDCERELIACQKERDELREALEVMLIRKMGEV